MSEPELFEDITRTMDQKPKRKSRLMADKYPQLSFFTADITGFSPKSDRHSMEHPLFTLSKKGINKDCITYTHGDIKITITPSSIGYATIWDKDILLYAVSQLMEAMNRGREISRTIRLTSNRLLEATQRGTGGRAYELLKDALTRLRGTTITTNLATNGTRRARGFGLIDEWEVIEKDKTGLMVEMELTISRWLFNAVTGKEVLTLNRDYFRLSGGLERRIYELARKHCGNQDFWAISIPLLYKKSGSQATLKEFRRMLKKIYEADEIPDYHLSYDVKNDNLVVSPKD